MSETLGERIVGGLGVSVTGMTITISTLVLLSLVILVLSKTVAAFVAKKAVGNDGVNVSSSGVSAGAEDNKRNGTSNLGVGSGATSAVAANPTAFSNDVSGGGVGGAFATADGELIAVFAAVISMMSGEKPFRITSYHRSSQNAPVWNLRGRSEYISGKLS